jgi:hypothetical protein
VRAADRLERARRPLVAFAAGGVCRARGGAGFYVWLSVWLALGMLLLAPMLYPLPLLGSRALLVSVAVFVAAWIGQFIGHAIEGRRPAFLEDVKSLPVGRHGCSASSIAGTASRIERAMASPPVSPNGMNAVQSATAGASPVAQSTILDRVSFIVAVAQRGGTSALDAYVR